MAGVPINEPCVSKSKKLPLALACVVSDDLGRAVLAVGARADQLDAEGLGALHDAAHEGRRETLRILLDAGANVNLRTRKGRTPLNLAKDDTVATLIRNRGGRAGESRP